MRSTLTALTAALALAAPCTRAQIITHDPLAKVDSLQSLINDMTAQITRIDTLMSMTGDRGYAGVLRNGALDNYVPPNVLQQLDRIDTRGLGGMSEAARRLRGTNQPNYCNTLAPAQRSSCEAGIGRPYEQAALLRQALANQQARLAQVRGLTDAIAGATDPQAIAQLQARLMAEQAALTRAQGEVETLRGLADSEERLETVRRREATLENLSRRRGLQMSTDPTEP